MIKEEKINGKARPTTEDGTGHVTWVDPNYESLLS